MYIYLPHPFSYFNLQFSFYLFIYYYYFRFLLKKQCKREGWSEKIKQQSKEGCNFHGHIEVNKVAGNFHFAPGKSFQQSHMHVHDIHEFVAGQNFDFSHTIHYLAFGDHGVGIINPLDETTKTTSSGKGLLDTFSHFLLFKISYSIILILILILILITIIWFSENENLSNDLIG